MCAGIFVQMENKRTESNICKNKLLHCGAGGWVATINALHTPRLGTKAVRVSVDARSAYIYNALAR